MPDRIASLDELRQLKDELLAKRDQEAERGMIYVTVGMGTCGIAAGALEVLHALNEQIETRHLYNVVVSQIGCIGFCSHEPILEVSIGDAPKVIYGKVVPDTVKRIIQEHILEGRVVEEFVIDATPFPTI